MKTYKAEVAYIGEKLRKKGAFEKDKNYQAIIDLHEAQNGSEILTLRRPVYTEVIDRAFYYSDDEFMVKLDKALEGIEDLIDEQEKKNK